MSGNLRRPRVGRIEFANCTPLFLALEEMGGTRDLDFVEGVPSELNRMLQDGEVDLSPSSSAEYLLRPDLYGFLPDLSISSIGPVASVLLFSRHPLEDLAKRPLGLTPASATSTLLLRVILESWQNIRPAYCSPHNDCAAVLWIGDRALAEAQQSGWPYVFDLGELWYRQTGTPFVFALWIARKNFVAERPNELRTVYRRLVEARQQAYRSYPAYARKAPQAAWLGEEALLAYWQTISYDLTAWHLQGLRLFAEETHRAGLLPAMPPLTPLAVEG